MLVLEMLKQKGFCMVRVGFLVLFWQKQLFKPFIKLPAALLSRLIKP